MEAVPQENRSGEKSCRGAVTNANQQEEGRPQSTMTNGRSRMLDAGEFVYHGPGIQCTLECFLPLPEEEEAVDEKALRQEWENAPPYQIQSTANMEKKDDQTSLLCKRCSESMTEDEVKNAKIAKHSYDRHQLRSSSSSKNILDTGELQPYQGSGIQADTDVAEHFLPNDEDNDVEKVFLRSLHIQRLDWLSKKKTTWADDPLTKPQEDISDNFGNNLQSPTPLNLMKPELVLKPDDLLRLLPDDFRNKIIGELGGQDLRLVLQKSLTQADVVTGTVENNFYMPFGRRISADFFSEQEKKDIEMEDKENALNAMECTLLDPGFETTTFKLKMWDYVPRYATCALFTTDWMKIVSENELKEKDQVQLWSYRVQDYKLAFALVKLKPEDHAEDRVKPS